jgi:hypothetical protein
MDHLLHDWRLRLLDAKDWWHKVKKHSAKAATTAARDAVSVRFSSGRLRLPLSSRTRSKGAFCPSDFDFLRGLSGKSILLVCFALAVSPVRGKDVNASESNDAAGGNEEVGSSISTRTSTGIASLLLVALAAIPGQHIDVRRIRKDCVLN